MKMDTRGVWQFPWGHCAFVLSLLSSGLPAPAWAQEAELALEPMIIVAKRPAAIADRPSSTVLDAAQLHERSSAGLDDLLASIPGVQANPGEPGQSVPTLRGIGTSTSSALLGTQQATTGIYLDDVPLTSPFGFVGTPDLTDFSIGRLEVMRGPQGVLYGSSSLGGAIQYVLAKPAWGQQHASLQAGVDLPSTGGLGTRSRASVDLPFADNEGALRVEAVQRHVPGYVDNLGTGQIRANALSREGLTATARWWAGGGTVVDATYLHQYQQFDDAAAVSPDPQKLEISTPSASRQSSRFDLARLQIDTPLAPGESLTSITALLRQQREATDDFTRDSRSVGAVYGPLLGLGPLPLLPLVQSLTLQPTRNQAVSQELRVTSDGRAGIGFVAGLFLQTTRFDNDTSSIATNGEALWGPAAFLLPHNQVDSELIHARAQENALFGEIHLPGPGNLDISLGGRAYRTAVAYGATLSFLGQATIGSPETHESGFTPRLGLTLPMGPHTLYASVAGGYRFGGVNFNPPALTPYRSDKLLDYEVGVHLKPADPLKVDLTAFLIDWRDAQVSTLLGGALPVIGVANVGQARSTGVEAAWQWQTPMAFDLSGALAGTDAHTLSPFRTAQGSTVPADAMLPGTPRWQTQLAVGRSFAAADDVRGRAVISHAWVGARVFDIEGSARAPSYQRLDASLSFTRGPWELAGRVSNLTNIRGIAGAEVVNRPGLAGFTDWYLVPPGNVGVMLGRAW